MKKKNKADKRRARGKANKKASRARAGSRAKGNRKVVKMSEEQRRLELIQGMMKHRGVKGNPRDYVTITQAAQIMDVNGKYCIKCRRPENREPENHVWVRGFNSEGGETVTIGVVVEDGYGSEGKQLLLRDDPRTREWVEERDHCSPLPLTLSPMLIHKRELGTYLGDRWRETFWSLKTDARRAKPLIASNEP